MTSSNVTDTAKDEAQQVLGEAKDKATDLLAEAKSQVDEQSRTQLRSMGGKLRELSDELDRMIHAGDTQGPVAELARQLSTRTRSLGSQLAEREPGDLVDELRRFARRRPGTFLIGAATAGVLAGRLTRGAKDSTGTTGARPAPPPPPAHAYRGGEPLQSDPIPPWTSAGDVR